MENKRRLIDADLMALEESEAYMKVQTSGSVSPVTYGINSVVHRKIQELIASAPTVDAVEVVNGYSTGDVCFYGYFGTKNKSLALVEIVKILNDERGVAELKFLKVFVDDTGNGLFDYLLRSGKTMNGSFEFLKNITPNCGARMDGDENA